MPDELVGNVLAGYRLEELIGRGGMSAVYRAEHIHLGKKVALKILSPVLELDEDFRERFLRESRIAASIEHPNIIPIYDAGEADGRLYIAMRHVDGLDLKQLIERDGPLSLGRTVYLIEQIGGALDAAHAHGLVHRDVKPGNVLVASGTERVFLTDFGVVKHGASTGLTRTGYFLGTIDYAAPEQIEGRPVDARTDVYAVGCLLYECLAGTPPFQRAGEMAAIHAHLTQEPPRASIARPELPAAVDDVISTAMAKQQAERYASAGALAHALRAAALDASPAAADDTAARPIPAATIISKAVTEQAAAVTGATPEPAPVPGGNGAAAAAAAAAEAATASPAEREHVQPTEPRRRGRVRRPGRRGVVLIAALLLLAGAGAAVAVVTVGGAHKASAGSGATAFPDAIEENLLLAHIPAAIRSTCTRIAPIAGTVFLRSVRCSQGGGHGTVTYSRSHSSDALRSYFLQGVHGLKVTFPTKHGCGEMQPAADEWSRQGLTTHVEGASGNAEGRVACSRGAKDATIFWTDTSTKMFVRASRPKAQWAGLYTWWEKTAGPEKELGTAMSSMGGATTAFPDAIEDELILQHVPAAIRSTCARTSSFDDSVFLRAVQCQAQPSGATVTYMYAHSGTAMTGYSNNQITAAGLDFPTAASCAKASSAADTWVRVGDIGHVERPVHEAGGRVLCYLAGGQAIMEWTDIDTGVYARATAPSSQRQALYDWWRDKAGPGPLEMASMSGSSTGTNGSQSGTMQSSTMSSMQTTTAMKTDTAMKTGTMTSGSGK